MYPTTPGNTQVYSPLGSFVVEKHDRAARHGVIKQRYAHNTYRSEKAVAIAWTLLIVGVLAGSIYARLGSPQLSPTSSATAAAIPGTVGSGATNRDAD
jgi:hypothetical protein